MANQRLNFKAWQSLVQADHRQVVEKFFGRYDQLTPESRKALFATHPDKEALSQKLEAGGAMDKASMAGVPYIFQDMFDARGLPTRCGAPFGDPFDGLIEDASLLEQRLDDHGACLLAKCVPSEFGWDMRGHNETFGDCPHAYRMRYVCGGGAGSCAHAVADGWAPIAFGLDTCGGIRIPAAFHGLFGFRMQNNNFAREGVFPIVPSLDAVGWMTANIDDLISSLKIFYRLPDDFTNRSPRGHLLKDSFYGISTESKTGLMELTRPLDIDEDPAVSKELTNDFKYGARAFQTIQDKELYSVHQHWVEEYRSDYDPHLLERIEAGRAYSTAESEEASFIQQNIRASIITFFRDYDYLIMPVSPLPSPAKTDWDNALEYKLLELNAPLSLSLLPALILPYKCGEGKYNAAQVILNPRKLQLVPKLLEQIGQAYDE